MHNSSSAPSKTNSDRTLILCPIFKKEKNQRDPHYITQEALGLAHALPLEIIGCEKVLISQIKPSTLIGKGKVEEFKIMIEENNVTLVIINHLLSPIQQRNLEKAWDCKVIDRTALIIDIFGDRASTNEGNLQVELASLQYQKSRLVRSWTHLERQRGGVGFLGGPGETQLESDKRMLHQRIIVIKEQLNAAIRTRKLNRKSRKEEAKIALVGYTNAGKSTLFNVLTNSEVYEADALFATLDPTIRALKLPSGSKAIMSDTVGFVTDLPHELIMAFRATLEEVIYADLILFVIDVSHPEHELHRAEVYRILNEIGVNNSSHKIIEILNKIDKCDSEKLPSHDALAIPISATSRENIDLLKFRIDTILHLGQSQYEFTLNYSEGKLLSWLYDHGRIVEKKEMEGEIKITIEMTLHNYQLWKNVVSN